VVKVLLVAAFGTDPPYRAHASIDCFSALGSLLWSYPPSAHFRFGNHDLDGPWLPHALIVSPLQRGVVWVAFSHTPLGISWVARIDAATGVGAQRYVNTGTIWSFDEAVIRGKPYLIIGGFNNEQEGANVAFFDETKPFAASPQSKGTRHECLSCPAGAPDYYFVFPRSEVNRLNQVYEVPTQGVQVAGSSLLASTMEMESDSGLGLLYEFSIVGDPTPVSARWSSAYDIMHRDLESKGALHHSLQDCPERTNPLPIRSWTPAGGWHEIQLKPAD
jgi:hypothetical protein